MATPTSPRRRPILSAAKGGTAVGLAAVLSFLLFLVTAPLHAQISLEKPDRPYLTMTPPRPVSVAAGRSVAVTLNFRIAPGFHINSSEPSSELLIPTQLTLKPATDLLLGAIEYPPGEDMAFAFAPDEPLSVYQGDFAVTVRVRAASAAGPGTHRVRGELRYQPCNDVACFPPQTMPIQFDVRVQRAPRRR